MLAATSLRQRMKNWEGERERERERERGGEMRVCSLSSQKIANQLHVGVIAILQTWYFFAQSQKNSFELMIQFGLFHFMLKSPT